jgi:hypothetical protein
VAAVLLVVTAGGLAGTGQAPGAPGTPAAGPTATAGPPPVNVGAYRLCLDPTSYSLPPEPMSVLLAGYANATKLASALPLGYPSPALVRSTGPDEGLRTGGGVLDGDVYDCNLVRIELDDQGRREFPTATATFVSFGFMPITATAHLSQVGTTPLTAVVYLDASTPLGSNGPYTVVATAQMSMRVSDVKVNGVPLDVGPDCHTTRSLSSPGNPIGYDGLVLSGGDNPGDPGPLYDFLAGGALAGTATVPSFTGCVGTGGEDLDPLLTATVSGPDNYVKIVQGPLCSTASTPQYCTPDGTPAYPPFWTVTHGGAYTASAPLILTSQLGRQVTTITCAHSTIAGTVPDATGPPRTDLGTLAWTGIGDCTDASGNAWTVASQGPMTLDARYYAASTGTSVLSLGNLSLHLIGPGGCTADVGSPDVGVTYANGGATLTLPPSPPLGSLAFLSKTCTSLHAGIQMFAKYPLTPAITITSP